ncbi:hypothetical protein [Streptomyces phytophilus]|uniref:hypothetical protein n=1 Tax=Streptomyces phytophilus TaxID=722715 RepID=UPI0015F1092F|nr:hypothetical protein [Streptomyces phytophilus]
MDNVAAEQARDALAAAEHARRHVAGEIGLPRGYWWGMAAGWLVLGAGGAVLPWWLTAIATAAFGAGHAIFASRLLSGRRRTQQIQVSAAVAGRRIPAVVIGMLVAFVAVTVVVALALDAEGTDHASIWAAGMVAAVVGFGGPEILRVVRRWVRA